MAEAGFDPVSYVQEHAADHGVPPELAHAILMAESGGRPGLVSPKGALGPMQVMPGTARDMGYDPDTASQQDLTDAGLKYAGQLHQRFGGDPRLTAAAYHAGPGAVERAGGIPNTSDQLSTTRSYVSKVTGSAVPDTGDGMKAAMEDSGYDPSTPSRPAEAAPTGAGDGHLDPSVYEDSGWKPPAGWATEGMLAAAPRGFMESFPQTMQMLTGGGAMAADAIDRAVGGNSTVQAVKNQLQSWAVDWGKEGTAGAQPSDDWENVHTFGDLSRFVLHGIGQGLGFGTQTLAAS